MFGNLFSGSSAEEGQTASPQQQADAAAAGGEAPEVERERAMGRKGHDMSMVNHSQRLIEMKEQELMAAIADHYQHVKASPRCCAASALLLLVLPSWGGEYGQLYLQ